MRDDFTPTAPPSDGHAGLLERLLDEAESSSSPPSETPAPFLGGPPSDTPTHPASTPDGPPPNGPSSDTPLFGSVPSPDGSPSRSGTPPVGNLLSGLLANPALLSALPTLMENLSPLLGSLGGSGGGENARGVRPHRVDRHTALLCAVKPYLSPARRDAAETVIRLCRVWDALERSGISLSGVLNTLSGAVPANTEGRENDV